MAFKRPSACGLRAPYPTEHLRSDGPQGGRSKTVILTRWVVLPVGNVPKETVRLNPLYGGRAGLAPLHRHDRWPRLQQSLGVTFETANDVTLKYRGWIGS